MEDLAERGGQGDVSFHRHETSRRPCVKGRDEGLDDRIWIDRADGRVNEEPEPAPVRRVVLDELVVARAAAEATRKRFIEDARHGGR